MTLAIQILGIMFPIVTIVTVGWILGRVSNIDMDNANRLNLDVFVPALVFSSLSDKAFSLAPHLSLALAGLVIVLGAGLLAFIISKTTHYAFRTIAPPLMFHNAGNVGLPIMSLAFGKPGLVTGLVLFLVGNITHDGLGTYILSAGQGIKILLRQAVLWAAVFALLINVSPITIPNSVMLADHYARSDCDSTDVIFFGCAHREYRSTRMENGIVVCCTDSFNWFCNCLLFSNVI